MGFFSDPAACQAPVETSPVEGKKTRHQRGRRRSTEERRHRRQQREQQRRDESDPCTIDDVNMDELFSSGIRSSSVAKTRQQKGQRRTSSLLNSMSESFTNTTNSSSRRDSMNVSMQDHLMGLETFVRRVQEVQQRKHTRK